MDILLLLVGLGLILAGANYLTDGASALAQRLRMPEFLIGLTVVAVGTSMPELIVSLLSAIEGKSDMAIGNVLGSNLFNGFFILGVCALIRPIPYTRDNVRYDIPFGILASALLIAAVLLPVGGPATIGRFEGILLLLCYATILRFTIRHAERPAESGTAQRSKAGWLIAVLLLGGLAGLIFGGDLFLDNATKLARRLGVSDAVIAITLLAGGTSLPELASSVVSLIKGKSALALGNVIGSNIANIFLILGLSATVHPLSTGTLTRIDFGAVLLCAVLLWFTNFTFRRKAIDRPEGVLFLALYAGYLWLLLR